MENYFDKIQDYLDGLLSEEESRAFEDQLAVNKELKGEVQTQKQLTDVLRSRMQAAKGLEAVKSNLLQNKKKYFDTPASTIYFGKPSRKIFTFRNWSIAVGIAACFLIGLSYFGVFSSNQGVLPALKSEVMRGGENQTEIGEAIAAFNDKDYQKSIRLFIELTTKNTKAIRFQYYLGLSYLGDKQWENAVKILVPVADGPSLYHEKASYFTAFAAWKLKNSNLALAYANRVSEDSPYYKKAQRLLKKME